MRIYLQRFTLNTTQKCSCTYSIGGGGGKLLERLKVNLVQKRAYNKMKVGRDFNPRSHLDSVHYLPKHYKTAGIQVVL